MSNTVGRGRGPMGRRRGMSGEKAKDFKDAMAATELSRL